MSRTFAIAGNLTTSTFTDSETGLAVAVSFVGRIEREVLRDLALPAVAVIE
jgi:hypothetical protein